MENTNYECFMPHIKPFTWFAMDNVSETIIHANKIGCKLYELAMHEQWRSQPNNSVSLCKFQITIVIHFFTNRFFSDAVSELQIFA